MRTEKQMLELILSVAKNDERIRAVYMVGSRVNHHAKKDLLQDYDIGYVVVDTQSFIRHPEWIDVFGERLIMQLPDEMDRLIGLDMDFHRSYTYLMQFVDGNRIDLTIQNLHYIDEIIREESLLKVLLDKDQIFNQSIEPSDQRYWVKKPIESIFHRCVNEFWWVSLYVAKGLWREEVTYAMDHLNIHVRPQLMDMIFWFVGVKTDFSVSIGKYGKYLQKYLSKDHWNQLLRTYPDGSIGSMWNALNELTKLFFELSLVVAEGLGFRIDHQEASRCLAFIKNVQKLPTNAIAMDL
jgi:aminoglycoside 6-adenylyltransferase